jgi:hypothetical protein
MHARQVTFLVGLALAALAWLQPTPARASGDFGCAPKFGLDGRSHSECDDVGFPDPANDTRTNLLLLMGLPRLAGLPEPNPRSPFFGWRDLSQGLAPRAPGASSLFADGEGSRCLSNDSGAAAFRAAVMAEARLRTAERDALVAYRAGLAPTCAGPAAGLPPRPDRARTGIAADFASYVEAAAAFYEGAFDRADPLFGKLARSRSPWLRETARYMVARVALNRAQADAFDDYGVLKEPRAANRTALAAAERGFGAYLKAYPGGRYAASADGLLRRVWWLAGDRAKLSAAYATALARADALAPEALVRLIEEVDDKLLVEAMPDALSDPLLLAIVDLRLMRGGAEGGLTMAALDAQKPRFRTSPALFGYLRAALALDVSGSPTEALRALAEVPPDHATLGFAREMLRGRALAATDPDKAAPAWTAALARARQPYQREAGELALAHLAERRGRLADVFADGAPVTAPILRKRLLAYVAGPELLRAQARQGPTRDERELALFVLLYKQLSRGRYAGFLSDLAMIRAPEPDPPLGFYDMLWADRQPLQIFRAQAGGDFPCPALRATAATLARAPADAHAQLCLADFFRRNGFDRFPLEDEPPASDELGGTKPAFPGETYARMPVYRAIIAGTTAAPEDRAYALYRAVYCFAPSGYSTCGGPEIGVDTRRDWFRELKSRYPKSRWAKALRYYW